MEELTLETLIAKIKDKDDKVRAAAWQAAGKVGAPALAPLAAVAKEGELEVSRAANRAMWQNVRYSGRPGAEDERKAAIAALIEVFTDDQFPVQLRRDVIWMLSEIVTSDDFNPDDAGQMFADAEFRDDMRMALQRIPGENAIAALKIGLENVPDEFKPAIAASLRARGVDVPNVPCVKLKPTKQTKVKPVGR